ncbi:hypothetical protein Tco_1228970, partial [Tanacetum coccineum]
MTDLFSTRLTDDHARDMICVISRHEVKDALFSMRNDKSYVCLLALWIIVSCCNNLFKCISKIIANHVKESLKLLNYHLDHGPSRCAFKVDIQKSYDTVDWGFLKEVLVGFGFHARMIGWIMEYYGKLELINLCFVDDLFLFAHGDVDSAIMIKDALEEFKNVSGLTPSLPKSTAYFCNVLNHTKLLILKFLPFEEGQLPVKYLGVPLVSSRLIFRDCKELIKRVQSHVQDWKNKSLSTVGWLQLIKSVIGSMHIYWASVFILPSRVLLDIKQLMRGFLWCQGELRKGRAKVAWE